MIKCCLSVNICTMSMLETPLFFQMITANVIGLKTYDLFGEYSHILLHLDWPTKSLDRNPIQSTWDILEKRINYVFNDFSRITNFLTGECICSQYYYLTANGGICKNPFSKYMGSVIMQRNSNKMRNNFLNSFYII